MMQALEPTQDPGWILTHERYNVLTENANWWRARR
jgi:hypothetical protein